jgi:predicted transcriptional regulator
MSSVQGAIKSLLDKDLIELTSENYDLTDIVFKNWLKSIP